MAEGEHHKLSKGKQGGVNPKVRVFCSGPAKRRRRPPQQSCLQIAGLQRRMVEWRRAGWPLPAHGDQRYKEKTGCVCEHVCACMCTCVCVIIYIPPVKASLGSSFQCCSFHLTWLPTTGPGEILEGSGGPLRRVEEVGSKEAGCKTGTGVVQSPRSQQQLTVSLAWEGSTKQAGSVSPVQFSVS